MPPHQYHYYDTCTSADICTPLPAAKIAIAGGHVSRYPSEATLHEFRKMKWTAYEPRVDVLRMVDAWRTKLKCCFQKFGNYLSWIMPYVSSRLISVINMIPVLVCAVVDSIVFYYLCLQYFKSKVHLWTALLLNVWLMIPRIVNWEACILKLGEPQSSLNNFCGRQSPSSSLPILCIVLYSGNSQAVKPSNFRQCTGSRGDTGSVCGRNRYTAVDGSYYCWHIAPAKMHSYNAYQMQTRICLWENSLHCCGWLIFLFCWHIASTKMHYYNAY